MEQELEKKVNFTEIVKKAYDRGLKESDLTLEKLLEEIEANLKNIVG